MAVVLHEMKRLLAVAPFLLWVIVAVEASMLGHPADGAKSRQTGPGEATGYRSETQGAPEHPPVFFSAFLIFLISGLGLSFGRLYSFSQLGPEPGTV